MIFQRSPNGGFHQVGTEAGPKPAPRGANQDPGPVLRLVDRVVSPVMHTVHEKIKFTGVWVTLTLTESSYVLHGMLGFQGQTHNVYVGKLADGTFLAGVD